MTKSESITNLATALAKAQAEMPVAPFDATNPFLKNKYASLRSIIESSRPILAKYKLSLVQFPVSLAAADKVFSAAQPSPGAIAPPSPAPASEGHRGVDYVGVESVLSHESGEFIAERIFIPLTEEKGKSKVQSAGSTLTYLRRYSWASILGMYADEDSDGCAPSGRQDHGPQTKGPVSKAVPALPPPPVQKG